MLEELAKVFFFLDCSAEMLFMILLCYIRTTQYIISAGAKQFNCHDFLREQKVESVEVLELLFPPHWKSTHLRQAHTPINAQKFGDTRNH